MPYYSDCNPLHLINNTKLYKWTSEVLCTPPGASDRKRPIIHHHYSYTVTTGTIQTVVMVARQYGLRELLPVSYDPVQVARRSEARNERASKRQAACLSVRESRFVIIISLG